jgi:epoxyqueuosine reductase QueG
MDNLNEIIMDAQWTSGACAVGVATLETLAGGPPSVDLSYVLPDAQSAIVFGFALDQELVGRYLRKEERRAHELDNIQKNMMASGAALFGEKFLNELGYPSQAICSNTVYRSDVPGGSAAMMPDISLRYLAVASGIAHFGLSGNVITRKEGAGIILGAIVTTAELELGHMVHVVAGSIPDTGFRRGVLSCPGNSHKGVNRASPDRGRVPPPPVAGPKDCAHLRQLPSRLRGRQRGA